jgi:hypothetical protein
MTESSKAARILSPPRFLDIEQRMKKKRPATCIRSGYSLQPEIRNFEIFSFEKPSDPLEPQRRADNLELTDERCDQVPPPAVNNDSWDYNQSFRFLCVQGTKSYFLIF